MTPAEESMFRFQVSVIVSAAMRGEDGSRAMERLIEDVNAMLAKRIGERRE